MTKEELEKAVDLAAVHYDFTKYNKGCGCHTGTFCYAHYDQLTLSQALRALKEENGQLKVDLFVAETEAAIKKSFRSAEEVIFEITALKEENERLEDENKSLKISIEQKSGEIGRAEHRGNTVDYIYDKLENYSKQLGEVAAENERLEKENESLKEEMDELNDWIESSHRNGG